MSNLPRAASLRFPPSNRGAAWLVAVLALIVVALSVVIVAGLWARTLIFNDAERIAAIEDIIEGHAQPRIWMADTAGEPALVQITGTVQTADGAPLPEDTRVDCQSRGAEHHREKEAEWLPSGADASVRRFRVEVPAGTITLAAMAPGYAPALPASFDVTAEEAIDEREIVLEKGFEATILLTDKKGNPAPNVPMRISLSGDNTLPWTMRTTGADGRVGLEHLSAHPLGVRHQANGYEEGFFEWTPQPGETKHVRIPRARAVTLSVVDGNDEPVPHARVYVLASRGAFRSIGSAFRRGDYGDPLERREEDVAVTAGEDGRAVLGFLRGNTDYDLLVESPNGGRTRLSGVTADDGERRVEVPDPIFLAGEVTGDLSQLESWRDGQVGVLTYSVSKMTFYERFPVEIQDGKGTFRVDGLWDGNVTMRIAHESTNLTLRETRDDLWFQIPQSTEQPQREVIVRFATDGAPEPRGSLAVWYKHEENSNVSTPELLSIVDGEARFKVPVPNNVSFKSLGTIGYTVAPDWLGERQPVPEGTSPHAIVLPTVPAGAVYGMLRGPAPDTGYTAQVYVLADGLPTDVSEESIETSIGYIHPGPDEISFAYTATPLPLGGVYRIALQSRDYCVISEPVALDVTQSVRRIDIDLPQDVALNGVVRTADGAPVANAEIVVSFEPKIDPFPGPDKKIFSDTDGQFVIESVNPEAWEHYRFDVIEKGRRVPKRIESPGLAGETLELVL